MVHGADAVPVIDLHDHDAATRIAAACERSGFLVITNHDVDDDVVGRAWEVATKFFDLPLEHKMSVAMPYPGYPYGYAPLQGERLAASLGAETPPDLKETFSMGPPSSPFERGEACADPAEAFVYEPTPWPAALPEFQTAMQAYYSAQAELVSRIMRLFAVALDLSDDFFETRIDRHTSALRVLNYPALTRPPAAGQLRAGAHTDYGTLTVLKADDSPGGLEVLVDERWFAVPLVEGSFIVNLGDAMARWTNDRWRSTLHRVVVPPAEVAATARRQSIAFFHNANWDAVIECIPSCLAPGDSPRYAPVTAGQHLMSKFQATQH
ncbi:MAG TPA: 2-oxoglutarate and iron-dependent oxygenase domain-containing protein [Ilumatobacteraceae bacterium]